MNKRKSILTNEQKTYLTYIKYNLNTKEVYDKLQTEYSYYEYELIMIKENVARILETSKYYLSDKGHLNDLKYIYEDIVKIEMSIGQKFERRKLGE